MHPHSSTVFIVFAKIGLRTTTVGHRNGPPQTPSFGTEFRHRNAAPNQVQSCVFHLFLVALDDRSYDLEVSVLELLESSKSEKVRQVDLRQIRPTKRERSLPSIQSEKRPSELKTSCCNFKLKASMSPIFRKMKSLSSCDDAEHCRTSNKDRRS